MNKTSNILVTGGTGLIGSYLLRKLVNNGYQNITAIKLPDDSTELVDDVANHISWQTADVRDQVSMHDYFGDVHTVIHCAGMISFWRKEFRQMYDVNVKGTEHIVNLCLEHNVSQLVHLSSIEAIGKNEDDSPIDEETEWKEEMQHTQYGMTKYLGELEVWRGKAEGLSTVIYNPALVLGAAYWNHGPMKLIKDIYHGLNYYPAGSIALIDVRDLVDVIVNNLENETLHGERIIVGSYNQTYKKLMDAFATQLKVSKPSKLLHGSTAQLAISWEKLKSIFTQSKPLINKETYIVSNEKLEYSFDKLNELAEFNPRSFEKTIADCSTTFKESYLKGLDFGVLPAT